MNPLGITFRPIAPEDAEFLYTVYASTRLRELSLVNWSELQKEAFLRSQFKAQQEAYQNTYRGADFLVLIRDERPIGRLYVARGEEEVRIVDIAILPEFRGQGIGSAVLTELLEEAAREQKRVSIHVEMFNPALSLYQRLGFRHIQDRGVYYFMQWTPPPG